MRSANVLVLIDRLVTSTSHLCLKIKCWFNLRGGTAGQCFLGLQHAYWPLMHLLPPTTTRGYVGIWWGLDTFGSRLPRISGRATSQILVNTV